ncbi:hypothetical protein FRUB_00549 [Fimbriiglobus ruber]|uniref:Uncharacterized protein n=1 Tax=Fimbriiglobus ruber TaxID=1908690 RepID=A0A225DZB4_9BACT|nr:hypothetical protein FRUB_00549 [Fimbriiglobus ruber]
MPKLKGTGAGQKWVRFVKTQVGVSGCQVDRRNPRRQVSLSRSA